MVELQQHDNTYGCIYEACCRPDWFRTALLSCERTTVEMQHYIFHLMPAAEEDAPLGSQKLFSCSFLLTVSAVWMAKGEAMEY